MYNAQCTYLIVKIYIFWRFEELETARYSHKVRDIYRLKFGLDFHFQIKFWGTDPMPTKLWDTHSITERHHDDADSECALSIYKHYKNECLKDALMS